MATIKISAEIPESCIPAVLRKHCKKYGHTDADFILTLPFDQLNIPIVSTRTEKTSSPLHFITDDLKPQLDALSKDFFSTLFPDSVITGDIRLETDSRFGFYLIVISEAHKHYIEGICLTPEETNHLCSAAAEYAAANGIKLPGQPLSWRERMSLELEEVLCSYIDETPASVISSLLPFVRENVLDALEADELQRQADMLNDALAVKYFWRAVAEKMKNAGYRLTALARKRLLLSVS